jgi:predicted SnoaL-like aldol condensation-catalyzing enzyme
MNDSKRDVPTLNSPFWPRIVALLCGILVSPITYSADDQVQENIVVVRQWIETVVDDDSSKANQFLSSEYIVHGETVLVSRKQRVQKPYDQRLQRGQSSFHQLELFGERDKVVALYSLKTAHEPVSGIQIFRMKNSKIEETWAQQAIGVLWEWNADIYGDTNAQANALVLDRWYGEVYKEANWQLVPEVAGPNFFRHENREFQMTGEEYKQRLRSFFKIMGGGMDIKYEVIAGVDKVAVIAKWRDTNWVQAWRVKDGKLVESWWVETGPDSFMGALIFLVVINIVLWGLFYWRRWYRNRSLKLLWHCLLPLALDIVLMYLILVFMPSLIGFTLALLACGTVVVLTALARILVYIAFTRRKE